MTKWQPGPKSTRLFQQAVKVIPGGVNSPVRGFSQVGLTPFFVKRAMGASVEDVDGHTYVDFMGSWGPLILGHHHPAVYHAMVEAGQNGLSFGAAHEMEVDLATRVVDMCPSIEQVRLVNSGTEATMSAIRLARGVTGRDKIIKFEGCYHGHADAFLINAGSGAATLGVPSSPGVPGDTARATLTAPYNDLVATEALLNDHHRQVAAIIVEPVAGNMGCIPPEPGFLEGLRSLCDHHGTLLVFDEVITGFRVAPGGAQERYGVHGDLTTLGKVLGGGMPVGAFGGRRDIMEQIAPTGPVYQAGTLAGNPLAVACGIAVLDALRVAGVHDKLEATGARMESLLQQTARAAKCDIVTTRVGSMLGVYFTSHRVTNFAQAQATEHHRFPALFSTLLANGVSIAPSGYESLFVSTAHSDDIIDSVQDAFVAAFTAAARYHP